MDLIPRDRPRTPFTTSLQKGCKLVPVAFVLVATDRLASVPAPQLDLIPRIDDRNLLAPEHLDALGWESPITARLIGDV